MNAQRASFDGRRASICIRERRVASSAECHQRWEDGRTAEIDRIRQEKATTGAEPGAGFQIRAHKQRHPRKSLHRIQFGRHLDRTADGHRETADLILYDPIVHPHPCGIARRHVVGKHTWPHHLAHFLAQRERRHGAAHPRTVARGHALGPDIAGQQERERGGAEVEAHQCVIVPCFVVSISALSPALNRNELMFFTRNWRDCGSITFRP